MGFYMLSIHTWMICILQVSQISSEMSVMQDSNENTPYGKTKATSNHIVKNTKDEHIQARGHVARSNWTREEIIDLIHSHGYTMTEGSGGQIYILLGDMLVYPQEIIPELQGESSTERRILLKRDHLWLNDKGEAQVQYFYDSQSKADPEVFEAAVKMWADSTCINFSKIGPNTCNMDLGHAAVCVGNFGGCFSLVGKNYGPGMMGSQQMSVQPGGCEDVAAAHEFGHALGLVHEMSRADRDEYIKVHYENVDIPLAKIKDERSIKSSWLQGGKCLAEKMYDAPKPYDPMSLMQYGASDFAETDQRIVYASLNPKHLYMFDYHRPCGLAQTHYDYYIINKGYRCDEKWIKACQSKGTTPPKCKNMGYTNESCKCSCPIGFSGDTCEKKAGPMFPVQERAKAQVDVTEPGVVDIAGKGLKDGGTYRKPDFALYFFIGVYIKSGKDTRISVTVMHDFSKVSSQYSEQQENLIKQLELRDCTIGLRLYVGDMQTGNARTECISRIINNEFPSEAPVFTSKNGSLDFIGMAGTGVSPYHNAPKTGRMAMELKFNVSFLEMPERVLNNPGEPGHSEANGALGTPEKRHIFWIIVIAAAVLILIVLIVVIVICVRRRKGKKAREKTKGEKIKAFFTMSGDSSESGTESESSSESD